MAYKDILVYAESDKAGAARLDLACSLAAAHQAHLAALHVSTPPYIPAMTGGAIPVELIRSQEDYQRQQAEAAREAVARAHQRSGVELEWRLAAGELAGTALLHSRYADLVVIGQATVDNDGPLESDILPETIVFGAGRPALIVPRYGKFPTCGERILIAWKRSQESTRAVHDALPFLTRAKSVTVMEVNPEKGDTHIAGADIARHLARHGVKAEGLLHGRQRDRCRQRHSVARLRCRRRSAGHGRLWAFAAARIRVRRRHARDPPAYDRAGVDVALNFRRKESRMTTRQMADIVRDRNPVTAPQTATVADAARKMRDRRVGAVLVIDGGAHLVGIFTGRDAVARVLAEGRDPAKTELRTVMTAAPVTLAPGKSAIDALRLMQDGGFRHVPVVDNGQVVGIVSHGDFRGLEQARLDEETGLWERI